MSALEIGVFGNSHLAQTLARAAEMRGMVVWRNEVAVAHTAGAGLWFFAEDVLNHTDLRAAHESFVRHKRNHIPRVLVSQVPPGTTRAWAGDFADDTFYQVDTLRLRDAMSRAYAPEQIVVGCADSGAPLPLAYQQYLMAFDCPVLQMSYESAELAKCAINYHLSAQIDVANDISAVAQAVGASYDDVVAVLANDARIGPKTYLRPGKSNQHLDRDVKTMFGHLKRQPGDKVVDFDYHSLTEGC